MAYSARSANWELKARLAKSPKWVDITADEAGILRKAEKTLTRWGEQECGDSNESASWAIERDEKTGVPYRVIYWNNGRQSRERIPDREAGALKRVAKLAKSVGGYFYHQTDPRGCTLYVGDEPLTNQNYSTLGIPCHIS